jgi:uncharacterized protein
MNILLFGATGRAGRRILAQALESGDRMTAFVREGSALDINHPNLNVIRGDALNAAAVRDVVANHDAVLSALGKLDAAQRVQAIDTIIAGMKHHNTRRIIAIGGSGCLQFNAEMRYHETPQFPSIFRNSSLAHWEVCKRLMASELDWTFVCPPDIPDGERTGAYTTQATFRPDGNRIFTGDLADFMLRELRENAFLKLRVGICNTP